MAPPASYIPERSQAYRLGVVKAIVAVITVVLALVGCASPAPSPVPTASPAPTATPLAETVLCVPEVGPLPSALRGDPCPAAILAVRAIVAPLGLPVARIVIEPGPFNCGDYWPGGSKGQGTVCAGLPISPGTTMHSWVSFAGSAQVAAVELSRPNPNVFTVYPSGTPRGTPSPAPRETWKAGIEAFEMPPTGWVMP